MAYLWGMIASIRIIALSLGLMAVSAASNGQQTVGTFLNTPEAFDGYTLLAPLSSTTTWLINNCGEVIHTWESVSKPGLAAYLLEDGTLLRTGKADSDVFSGGGMGGYLEILDWESNVLWSHTFATPTLHSHHDVEPMPNGNILVIAWEAKDSTEAIASGINPLNIGETGIWPSVILEIEPVGTNEINTVWEWHLWDHLVQDFDAEKPGFGTVADHPELMDINFHANGGSPGPGPGGGEDWIHLNAVDYHAELDQIVVSSRNISEIYIIDHSTTTEEAAGHTGGMYGKGGDFLYRWGNPQAYDHGGPADQQFGGQHDSRWIESGFPGEGGIMVFNNDGTFAAQSSVDVIYPPQDSPGVYTASGEDGYLPSEVAWTWTDETFFSSYISGAERLSNGNTIICEGASGTLWEVDLDGNVVWQYINPVSQGQILEQGQAVGENAVFRIARYSADYDGLQGVDLTPGNPIELNPFGYACELYPENPQAVRELEALVYVSPNPFAEWLNIELINDAQISILTPDGRVLESMFLQTGSHRWSATHLPNGVYLLSAVDGYSRSVHRLIHY